MQMLSEVNVSRKFSLKSRSVRECRERSPMTRVEYFIRNSNLRRRTALGYLDARVVLRTKSSQSKSNQAKASQAKVSQARASQRKQVSRSQQVADPGSAEVPEQDLSARL